MNKQNSTLFERLNTITYPIYHSNNSEYIIWEDSNKERHLYTVKELNLLFEISNPDGTMLADNMTVDRVMNFIEEDMNIGSPIPGSMIVSMGKTDEITDEQGFKKEVEEMVEEISTINTKNIIAAASRRHYGNESVGNSLLQDLAARQKITKKTSGTIKKKRKFNIDDLDLEEGD